MLHAGACCLQSPSYYPEQHTEMSVWKEKNKPLFGFFFVCIQFGRCLLHSRQKLVSPLSNPQRTRRKHPIWARFFHLMGNIYISFLWQRPLSFLSRLTICTKSDSTISFHSLGKHSSSEWKRGEACYSEKRLHQVFVNLSLIISSELENKLPANDAEPQIMTGF